jgi:hypothetical protein
VANDPKEDLAPKAGAVEPPRDFPRPPAKGEEKELAWPKAGGAELPPRMPRLEVWPKVGREARPIVGAGGSPLAPRTEGWPNVAVEAVERGAVGRLCAPKEGARPKAGVAVFWVPRIEGAAGAANAGGCWENAEGVGWENAEAVGCENVEVKVFVNAEGAENAEGVFVDP